mgnify:CR=1 FL=1
MGAPIAAEGRALEGCAEGGEEARSAEASRVRVRVISAIALRSPFETKNFSKWVEVPEGRTVNHGPTPKWRPSIQKRAQRWRSPTFRTVKLNSGGERSTAP